MLDFTWEKRSFFIYVRASKREEEKYEVREREREKTDGEKKEEKGRVG